jgi:hypothetical protein
MKQRLRAMGDQEFDITTAVSCRTKYAEMVIDASQIRYNIEKALYWATHGRIGHCWLDIAGRARHADRPADAFQILAAAVMGLVSCLIGQTNVCACVRTFPRSPGTSG